MRALSISYDPPQLTPYTPEHPEHCHAGARTRSPTGRVLRALAAVAVLAVLGGPARPLQAQQVQQAQQGLDWAQRMAVTTYVRPEAHVAPDGSGGVYLLGNFDARAHLGSGANAVVVESRGDQDMVLARFARDGTLLWHRVLGTDARTSDLGGAMAADSAGNLYLAGFMADPDAFPDSVVQGSWPEESMRNSFVAKLDPDGTLLWVRTLGTLWPRWMAVTEGGGAVVAGIQPEGIYRVDAHGRLLWSIDEQSGKVALDASGCAYVAGDSTLTRLTPEGRVDWVRRFGGTARPRDPMVGMGTDGLVRVGGTTWNGDLVLGSGEDRVRFREPETGGVLFLAAFDTTGALAWAREAAAGWMWPTQLAVDGANRMYVAGRMDSHYGGHSGDTIEVTTRFGTGADARRRTVQGTTAHNARVSDAFLAAYDRDGSLLWVRQDGGTDNDAATAVAVSGPAVYTAGFFGRSNNQSNGGAAAFFGSGPRTQRLGHDGWRSPYSGAFPPNLFLARYGPETTAAGAEEHPYVTQASVFSSEAEAAEPDTLEWVYRVENPGGVDIFPDFESGTLEQAVHRESDTAVTITVRVLDRVPTMPDPYPVDVPDSIQRFLDATAHIQSGDPEIARVAARILELADPDTEGELVNAVLHWNRSHMKWDRPDEVPDALTSLHRGTGNCIGFVNLPAAILRHLGVPARTVRTFFVRQGHLVPHYQLDVYFPESNRWLTYEPQGPSTPDGRNLVLYTDPDWSPAGQQRTRPFSRDPATHVTVLARPGGPSGGP